MINNIIFEKFEIYNLKNRMEIMHDKSIINNCAKIDIVKILS